MCIRPDGNLNPLAEASCASRGGRFWRQSPWMLHAWLFRPGPEGVFSLANSRVHGPQLADVSAVEGRNNS